MSEITIKEVAELGCPHCGQQFEIVSDERQSEVSTRERWESKLTCSTHGEFLYRYDRHFGYAQEGTLGQRQSDELNDFRVWAVNWSSESEPDEPDESNWRELEE